MKRTPTFNIRQRKALGASLALIALWPHLALADGPIRPTSPPPAAYAQECASCHMAYPPGLLPASSWQHLMDGLSKHFGSDASVDTASQTAISRWLQANAGTYKRVSEAPPQDRITRSAWFERKHRGIPAATFSRPSIKSAAQCQACHTRAEQGDFDDDNVRIPR